MRLALSVIGILCIASGAFLVIYTERARVMYGRLSRVERIRWVSGVPFLFGLILVAGAFRYREMFWFALVLGALGLTKGALLILWPEDRIRAILQWWVSEAAEGTLRLFGLIAVIVGSALLSYLI